MDRLLTGKKRKMCDAHYANMSVKSPKMKKLTQYSSRVSFVIKNSLKFNLQFLFLHNEN